MIAVANLIRYEQKPINTIESAYVPHTVIISLMYENIYCEPDVYIGDFVREGQVIARNVKHHAYIHASIPGKIVAFRKESMSTGKKEDAIVIQLEGEFTYLGKRQKNIQWLAIPPSQRIKTLYQMGVLNTFETPVLLAKQIDELRNKRTNTLALRLYDADPSIITESFISQQYTEEILEAASIIADTVSARTVYVLYAQDSFAIPTEDTIKKTFRSLEVFFIPVKTQFYPQGTLHEVAANIEQYMTKELKRSFKDPGLTIDATTALDTYKAIVQDIPLIDKIVHVSGDCFARDTIIKVKVGTPIHTILHELGGFVQRPSKIIINGLIKGKAIAHVQGPITRETKSITVLSKKEIPDQKQSPCIRCGRCHQICPTQLHPEKLFRDYMLNTPLSEETHVSAQMCTECALCNMVCPSRLPLYQTILLLKEQA